NIEDEQSTQRVSRNKEGVVEAESKFTKALAHVKPVASAVMDSVREMNTPDEIGLEFGLKFGAKAGVIFTSADSEATFKLSLKWKNEKK
ncbi:MAG: hypothetical protein GY816_13615, partial [Cytophagales bacterium]|nr:hypothetical protein [Cytophagales bacterium]